jgi:integrase
METYYGMNIASLSTKVMELGEIRRTLEHLRERMKHSYRVWAQNAWLNLMIYRLSTCCGLRGCEFRRLRLDDFVLGGSRPIIRVRKEITKGQTRTRAVPLWWDAGTRDEITEFVQWRRSYLSENAVALIADFDDRWQMKNATEYMDRRKCWRRWKRFVGKALGEDRVSQLGVHAGRHSFCTHALANGRTLAEVRDAAGHSNISITNIYLHALETGSELPDLFPEEDDSCL